MVKRKAYNKTVRRAIGGSMGRFMAIFAIVALGVGFLAGLLATTPDMRNSVGVFYNETNVMDLRILANLGLVDDDIDAISSIEGVRSVMPAKQVDVPVLVEQGSSLATRVHGIDFSFISTDDPCYINRPSLLKGRWPENSKECIIERDDGFTTKINIGDTIHVASDATGADDLDRLDYTVVGVVTSGFYLSTEHRGPTSVGNGVLSAIMYIDISNFNTDYYTEAFITIEGAQDAPIYSSQYKEHVKKTETLIEDMANTQKYVRSDNIRNEALTELEDAKKELAEGEADGKEKLTDAHTELEDGEEKYLDGLAEYEQGKIDLAKAKEDYAQGLIDFEKEIADARTDLEKGTLELQDAELELANGWAELEDARIQLEDALKALEDGWTELEDGMVKLEDGWAELEDARVQIEDAEDEIADGYKQIDAARAELNAGQAQVTEGEALAQQAQQQIDDGYMAYNQSKAKLDKQASDISAAKTAIEQLHNAYENASTLEEQAIAAETLRQGLLAVLSPFKDSADLSDLEQAQLASLGQALTDAAGNDIAILGCYNSVSAFLSSVQSQISAGYTQLQLAKDELEKGQAELEQNRAYLAAMKKKVNKGLKELARSEDDLSYARSQLRDAKAQYEDGLLEYNDSFAEYEDGLLEYNDGLAEYNDNALKIEEAKLNLEQGKLDLEQGIIDGQRELDDGAEKIDDGEATLIDSEQELLDARIELDDGWADYEQGVLDFEEEIADANDKIIEATDKINDIDAPEWYILDRDTIPAYVSYDGDTQKVAAIAKIFPIFFFAVAALVSATTMTRMVDEERGNIGTMKALGYGNATITAKYMIYAGVAGLCGSIVGLAVGLMLFPRVIYNAYKLMYNLPKLVGATHWIYGIVSTILIMSAIFVSTYGALRGTLKENTASLMRPKAPPAGTRIFLERITPLWKAMKFTHKVTARNLFRYKKRFLMTVVGIAGCTALLVTGFGLRDSISDIVGIQFGELMNYNMTLDIKHDGDDTSDRRIKRILQDPQMIERYTTANSASGTAYMGNAKTDVYVVTPADPQLINSYITFRDRRSGQSVPFGKGQVILTEKASKTLGISAGDTISLDMGDYDRVNITITNIAENYVHGYIYIAPDVYQKLFGETPEYTTVYAVALDETNAQRDAIAEALLLSPNAIGVSFSKSVAETFADMLESISYIVIVLIICAGLLAFVVLYNLTNINITERQKELATIKVLGFTASEVSSYIYRETVILSLVGAAVGLICGVFLHSFVIITAEVDAVMFGRIISPLSYIYSAALTMGFTVLVNIAMSFKLKKIDMVESLKAPE